MTICSRVVDLTKAADANALLDRHDCFFRPTKRGANNKVLMLACSKTL